MDIGTPLGIAAGTWLAEYGNARKMGTVPETLEELAAHARTVGSQGRILPAPPLMHGTGLWLGALMHHMMGGHVITLTSRSLDAHEMLAAIQQQLAAD